MLLLNVKMSISTALFVLYFIIMPTNEATKKPQGKDYFTALVDIASLIHTEHMLTRPFLELVKKEEEKLDQIEKSITDIENVIPEQDVGLRELTDFIGNPINSLKLVQRLTSFWPKLSALVAKQNKTIELQKKIRRLLSLYQKDFPDEEDVKGAIAAIFRLQDFYRITPRKFSDGLGRKAHELIVEEIFELGYIALGQGDFEHAQSWLRECLDRFHPDAKQIGFVDKVSLLEYLAWSEYKIGNFEEAIRLTEQVLEIKPDSAAANANIQFFEEDFAKLQLDPNYGKPIEKPKFKWQTRYEAMCNNKEDLTSEERMKLFCRYEIPDPVFTLMPLKAEDSFSKPRIITYHDFLNDREIEHLKTITRRKLKRATVHDPATGMLTYSNVRISKSAWIREDEDVIVGKLYKRVQALSGLDMMFSEPLQVVNYGMGGYYEPHFDYATKANSSEYMNKWRNRIATALIYMSDVEHGGNTVFVEAGPGAITRPRKGSLAFWYNLKKSGKGDVITQHAACPVLLGNKWVANFWVHEFGQEFRRRCGLTKDE